MDDGSLRFGSPRGRLPSPRDLRLAADGSLAWSLCEASAGRVGLVAWHPESATLAWRVELVGEARFAVSPDDALLLVVEADGTRTLRDARTGVSLAKTRGAPGLPEFLALADTAARRALAVRGETATVLDLDTGAAVATLAGRAPAALSPDGQRVALTVARAVIVHDLRDGTTARHPLRDPARVTAIDLAESLAVGFSDGSARAVATLRPARVSAAPHPVTALRRGGDGSLAVGRADGSVRVLSAAGRSREAVGEGPVAAIAADLSRVLFREARAATALDLRGGLRHDPRAGHRDALTAVAVSRDGRRVLTASRDATLRAWDADSRETLMVLEGHAGPVAAMALSPDGRTALSCGSDDGLRVWRLDSGEGHHLVEGVRARALVASPCGRWVAALTAAEALVFDLASGALRARAPLGPWGAVAAFGVRGDVLAVPRSQTAEGVVLSRVDVAAGAALEDSVLPLAPRAARRARGCADLRALDDALVTAETDRAGVTRWTLAGSTEGEAFATGSDLLRGPTVALRDGVLAAAAGSRVDVCRLADGARRTFRLPERHDAVTSLAIAPEGRWLVVGSAQGLAQRFDL